MFLFCNGVVTTNTRQNYINNKVIYAPGKASNAGGVAVSGLEIEQNKKNEHWSFEKVDNRLKGIG